MTWVAPPFGEGASAPNDPNVSPSKATRLDSLTGLRWLAAFWVFAYHMSVFGALPHPFELPVRLGFMGVTFFFVLSGFVLTWSMRPSLPVSTFYVRRFARIWPAHMVALIIAVPVFTSVFAEAQFSWVRAVDIPVLLLSVLLLQGFSRRPEVLFSGNPAAWTLSCEALFYAAHPILARPLRRTTRRGSIAVAAGILVVAFAYRTLAVYGPGDWAASVPLPLDRAPQFAFGIALAWALVKGWRPRVPLRLAWAVFVAIIAWLTIAPERDIWLLSATAGAYANEFTTLACGILIVAAATGELRGRPGWLASALMVRLGDWSYAFYLVHSTVMYAVIRIIGGPRGPGFSNLLWGAGIFAVALALAAALHHLVEAPAERRIRRWKARRDLAKAGGTAHEQALR